MKKIKLKWQSLLAMLLLIIASNSYAALDLELTQGIDKAVPIAILPFYGQVSDNTTAIATIMRTDLRNSGLFQVIARSAKTKAIAPKQIVDYDYWRKQGADNIVVGDVTEMPANYYQVNFKLLSSLGNKHVLLAKQFTVPGSELRHLAHYLSDLVYQQLIGARGVFSTRIAYVLVEGQKRRGLKYKLEVADADGFNPQPLLVSSQPIMSPAWSPDGHKIAYVSFEKGKPEIYVVDVMTGKRSLISSQRGINGAPAWSPDGKELALVLSKDGSPHIYIYNVASKDLSQITHGRSIDTEPSWAPDGRSLIFTSDRGGSPQVYRFTFANQRVERVTFDGSYNASASFTPNGKQIILLHGAGGSFNIAVQDVQSGKLHRLTRAGKSESPSISPNGKLILYATQYGGKRVLSVVSLDNKVRLRLPARGGDVQEPAWSPFTR